MSKKNFSQNQTSSKRPLADLLRPQSFDEILGQQHLFGEFGALAIIAKSKKVPSMILQGPAGVGKTSIAKILAKIVAQEQPQLVIMGKQAIDDDSNQCGQMLAALLGWPQATHISNVTINGDTADITREIEIIAAKNTSRREQACATRAPVRP